MSKILSKTEFKEFQFLIGRLVTEIKEEGKQIKYMFQFLIGRLVTENITDLEILLIWVSIPHR